MPEPNDNKQLPPGGQDPMGRLDRDLDAFEAGRRKTASSSGLGGAAGDGYRLLGQMLGGVLGGIGLGWLVDHYVQTSPWGVVGGLLIGAGLSIYSTIRTASRISARTQINLGPADPAPVDDDDDEA